MNEQQLNKLCAKKRETKKAIEETKAEMSNRKLAARRAIEDRMMMKRLGL